MAIRKKNPLGPLSGKLGKTVTRIRNGKEVVYSLPEKVNVSQSKEAKAARRKFGLTVNFAKYLNSVPLLSGIWSYAKITGTNSYQKLIKHNAKLTGEKSLTVNNIITPGNINLVVEDFNHKDNLVNLLVKITDKKASDLLSPKIQSCSVIYLFEPKNKKANQFYFCTVIQEVKLNLPNNTISINIDLEEVGAKILRDYKKCIIYTAIMSSKGDSTRPVWTNTVAEEIKL